jgi:hypothetical protein
MRNRRRNWFLRRLVLGFAIALVVVPVAQAHPFEGATPSRGHAGADTQGTFVQGVDDFPGSSLIVPRLDGPAAPAIVLAPQPESVTIRGDDKSDIGARPLAGILVGDDKRNVPLGTNYEPVQVVSNPSNGFDWGDAGIGAGTVFAVMLLGAGALLATRHVGRPASV